MSLTAPASAAVVGEGIIAPIQRSFNAHPRSAGLWPERSRTACEGGERMSSALGRVATLSQTGLTAYL